MIGAIGRDVPEILRMRHMDGGGVGRDVLTLHG